MVLYVIGVPFGVFLSLLRKNNVSRRDQLPLEEQETLDSWLGSIYLLYKKEFRSYFEIFFLMRRMLIAFSLSFIFVISDDSSLLHIVALPVLPACLQAV